MVLGGTFMLLWTRIEGHRVEVNNELAALRAEMRQNHAELRDEMRESHAELRGEIGKLESLILSLHLPASTEGSAASER